MAFQVQLQAPAAAPAPGPPDGGTSAPGGRSRQQILVVQRYDIIAGVGHQDTGATPFVSSTAAIATGGPLPVVFLSAEPGDRKERDARLQDIFWR
jgi:hypothetical protein